MHPHLKRASAPAGREYQSEFCKSYFFRRIVTIVGGHDVEILQVLATEVRLVTIFAESSYANLSVPSGLKRTTRPELTTAKKIPPFASTAMPSGSPPASLQRRGDL